MAPTNKGTAKATSIGSTVKLSIEDELEYSAAMLRELRDLASARRDTQRAYFIEMAYVETCDRLREVHSKKRDSKERPSKAA